MKSNRRLIEPDQQDAFTFAVEALGALKLEAELQSAPARALAETIAKRNTALHQLQPHDRSRSRLTGEVAKLAVSLAQLEAQQQAATQLYCAAQKAFDSVTDWSQSRIAPVDPSMITDDASDAVAAARAELTELNAQLAEARRAPQARAALVNRLRDWIERQSGRKVDVKDFVAGGPFMLPRAFGRGGLATPVLNDFENLALKACGPAIEAMVMAHIDATTDFTNALTDDERRERLATLRNSIANAEWREEAAIRKAALSGVIIARRGEANPWPALGVTFEKMR